MYSTSPPLPPRHPRSRPPPKRTHATNKQDTRRRLQTRPCCQLSESPPLLTHHDTEQSPISRALLTRDTTQTQPPRQHVTGRAHTSNGTPPSSAFKRSLPLSTRSLSAGPSVRPSTCFPAAQPPRPRAAIATSRCIASFAACAPSAACALHPHPVPPPPQSFLPPPPPPHHHLCTPLISNSGLASRGRIALATARPCRIALNPLVGGPHDA